MGAVVDSEPPGERINDPASRLTGPANVFAALRVTTGPAAAEANLLTRKPPAAVAIGDVTANWVC